MNTPLQQRRTANNGSVVWRHTDAWVENRYGLAMRVIAVTVIGGYVALFACS